MSTELLPFVKTGLLISAVIYSFFHSHLSMQDLHIFILFFQHECIVLLEVLLGKLIQLNLFLQLTDPAERFVLRCR